MRLHPREERCRAAANELVLSLFDLVERHDLTEAEALRVIGGELASWIGAVAKFAIRQERHGNSDTPGGLE